MRLGRPKTGSKVETEVRARLAKGDGIKKVAKAIGVATAQFRGSSPRGQRPEHIKLYSERPIGMSRFGRSSVIADHELSRRSWVEIGSSDRVCSAPKAVVQPIVAAHPKLTFIRQGFWAGKGGSLPVRFRVGPRSNGKS